jgi:hypothetical protein
MTLEEFLVNLEKVKPYYLWGLVDDKKVRGCDKNKFALVCPITAIGAILYGEWRSPGEAWEINNKYLKLSRYDFWKVMAASDSFLMENSEQELRTKILNVLNIENAPHASRTK